MLRTIGLLLSLLLLCGCYSPVARPYDPEQWSVPGQKMPAIEQTYEKQIGGGIHAWPWLDTDRSTPRHRTDVLWPVVKHVEQPEGWYFRIAPLLWLKRTPKEDYTFVWPFYGKYKRGDRTVHNVAFPFLWRTDTPQGWSTVLFPFVWLRREPNEEHTWVWPFYGEVKDEESTERHYLWPLVKHERNEDGGWSFRAFPFLWINRQPDHEWSWLVPLFGQEKRTYKSEDGSEQVFERKDILYPVVNIESNTSDHRGSFSIFPFFLREVWDAGERVRMLPFYWRGNDRDADSGKITREYGAIWPLHVWDRSDSEQSWWAPWPLNYSRTTKDSRTRWIAPVLSKESPEKSSKWVLPLYGDVRTTDTRTLHIAPPVFKRMTGPDLSEWSVWPFFQWTDSPKNTVRKFWPVAGRSEGRWQSGDEEQSASSWFALWPFFRGSKDPDSMELNAPWPLYQVEKTGEHYSQRESFPAFKWLVRRHEQPDGSTRTDKRLDVPQILPMLLAHRSTNDVESGWVLGPLFFWKFGDNEREMRLLWQLAFHKESDGNSTSAVYPFFYKETNDKGESSTGLFYDLIRWTERESETDWRLAWFLNF